MRLRRTATHFRNVAKKFETLRAHAQAFCLSRAAKFYELFLEVGHSQEAA